MQTATVSASRRRAIKQTRGCRIMHEHSARRHTRNARRPPPSAHPGGARSTQTLSVFASAQQRTPDGGLAVDCTVTGRLAVHEAVHAGGGIVLGCALVAATLPHTGIDAGAGLLPSLQSLSCPCSRRRRSASLPSVSFLPVIVCYHRAGAGLLLSPQSLSCP